MPNRLHRVAQNPAGTGAAKPLPQFAFLNCGKLRKLESAILQFESPYGGIAESFRKCPPLRCGTSSSPVGGYGIRIAAELEIGDTTWNPP